MAGASQSSSAADYIAHKRFHQRFALPATEAHGELQVSYADVGRTPEQGEGGGRVPSVLFIPGMFASRHLGVWMHAIAEKLGVRVLIVDRPGMGHSTDVPLQQRVETWIELVPALLAHLHIEHVALASHSAGTIYLLNTLIRCRDVLDPSRPLVALVAPWVDPAHSHVTTMQMAQSLPTTIFSIWHYIPKVAISSGTAFNQITNLLPSSSGLNAGDSQPLERNRRRIESDYGLPITIQKEMQTLTLKAMHGESTVGANSEALCCLRKGPAGLWGECEDYASFVRKLAGLERRRLQEDHVNGNKERLRIKAFFAETDSMIGKRGQSYMEDCWKGSNGEDEFRDVLEFTTTTINETDHDSVVQSVDVLEQIFLSAGGAPPVPR